MNSAIAFRRILLLSDPLVQYFLSFHPDVHAMLLSDVLVFLQEKDQKYVFASLVSCDYKDGEFIYFSAEIHLALL